jgi:esterase/lipase superfamily enzyme
MEPHLRRAITQGNDAFELPQRGKAVFLNRLFASGKAIAKAVLQALHAMLSRTRTTKVLIRTKNGRVTFEFDPKRISIEGLVQAVGRIGQGKPEGSSPVEAARQAEEEKQRAEAANQVEAEKLLGQPPPPYYPPPVAAPSKTPESNRDPRLIGVLYATNRSIGGRAGGEFDPKEITYKRTFELSYGSTVVRVPDCHRIGTVERPLDLTIFGFTVWKTKENEKKHFTLKKLEGFSKERFIDLVKEGKNKGVMVFVHGFDTGFIDAVFKTAQIAWDNNFLGVPVTFAWPSKASITHYDYDRESALFSRDAFLNVLRMIYEDAAISKIYVIAHSMGNQIVVDSLAHAHEAGIGISLSELVLASPDVDSDVFRSMVDRLRKATKGLTLYASSADKAMVASRIKAGGVPRAGDVPASGPLIAEGMDTIDVTAIGTDPFALNHSEYSTNRSLIDDIGRIILTSTRPPSVRSPQLRGVPERSEHPLYWRYAR